MQNETQTATDSAILAHDYKTRLVNRVSWAIRKAYMYDHVVFLDVDRDTIHEHSANELAELQIDNAQRYVPLIHVGAREARRIKEQLQGSAELISFAVAEGELYAEEIHEALSFLIDDETSM